MDHRVRVARRDLDRRVDAGRGRAADQQRRRHPLALHRRRDVDHLVQRRRDQPRQPDEVRADLARRVQDPRGRHHDPEVDHLVVVAAQHDAHDVLADVVDVALDGGHHDRAGTPARALPLRLEVGDQDGHGLLHHPGALDHLGQEHPAGTEPVADDVHAGHQRPLDHVQRPRRQQPGLLGVLARCTRRGPRPARGSGARPPAARATRGRRRSGSRPRHPRTAARSPAAGPWRPGAG